MITESYPDIERKDNIPDPLRFKKITNSERETFKFGEKLAQLLRPGDVVALMGELGSGKTCLIKGICRGLEVKEEVTSPSFVLIDEYKGKTSVYHFDFYRIEREEEAYQLGCEEYFYESGVSLIEWADRVLGILPPNRIQIHLKGFFKKGWENVREIEVREVGKIQNERGWERVKDKAIGDHL